MELTAYAILFLISLGAATILPFQSEWAVVALLLGGEHPWEAIIAFASLGNVLGR